MRLLIDSLIALMLVGILGVLLMHHRQQQQRIEHHRQIHEALSDLYEQTLYHSVLDPELGRNLRDPLALNRPLHQFPDIIEPGWFEGAAPRNPLAREHPWVDVAPQADDHIHPPDPILRRDDQAGFWYNPARGIFRARVPAQISEEATLELYNKLNNVALTELVESGDAARQPTIPVAMQLASRRHAAAADAAEPVRDAADLDAAADSGAEAQTAPERPHRPALLRAAEASLAP